MCTGPLYLPHMEADGKMYVKYQVSQFNCHSAFMTNDHGPAFLKRLREVYKNHHSSLLLATALSQNGRIAEKQRRKVNEKCFFETPHSESKKQI